MEKANNPPHYHLVIGLRHKKERSVQSWRKVAKAYFSRSTANDALKVVGVADTPLNMVLMCKDEGCRNNVVGPARWMLPQPVRVVKPKVPKATYVCPGCRAKLTGPPGLRLMCMICEAPIREL